MKGRNLPYPLLGGHSLNLQTYRYLTNFLLNGEKISHAFIYVTYDLPEYFVPSLMYKLIFS